MWCTYEYVPPSAAFFEIAQLHSEKMCQYVFPNPAYLPINIGSQVPAQFLAPCMENNFKVAEEISNS